MNNALRQRGKRLACWFGWHWWGMYWSQHEMGYEDRCIYCNRPRRKK